MKLQSYCLLVENILTVMFEQLDFVVGNFITIDLVGGQFLLKNDGCHLLFSKQEFLFEIWLSSSISGAIHFFFDVNWGGWFSKRDFSVELFNFVEFEVGLISDFLVVFDKVV